MKEANLQTRTCLRLGWELHATTLLLLATGMTCSQGPPKRCYSSFIFLKCACACCVALHTREVSHANSGGDNHTYMNPRASKTHPRTLCTSRRVGLQEYARRFIVCACLFVSCTCICVSHSVFVFLCLFQCLCLFVSVWAGSRLCWWF